MPDWSSLGFGQQFQALADTANSRGINLTAPGTLNTKGAYTQLVAATSFDAIGIQVHLGESLTGGVDILVDIAIGGAGSETIILSNLQLATGTGNVGKGSNYFFPIFIPVNTRLSARFQSTNITSVLCRVAVQLIGGGFLPPAPMQHVETYGSVTASSTGTVIDPGGTAHTKGAWTQLTASTTYPIRAIVLGVGNLLVTARTSCDWLADIGIGAAGSEQVLIGNIWKEASSTDDVVTPIASPPWLVDIPAATRLSVRSQCSIITAGTVRQFSASLYGVS